MEQTYLFKHNIYNINIIIIMEQHYISIGAAKYSYFVFFLCGFRQFSKFNSLE